MANNVPLNPSSHLPEKVTVYHSELVHACTQHDGNGLWVQFRSDVRKSTYGEGKNYIPFVAAGDTMEHKYYPENDAITDVLRQCPKNVPLFIRAEGSRDTATLTAWTEQKQKIGGGAAAAPAQQQQQTQQRQGNGAAPSFNAPAQQPAAPRTGNGNGSNGNGNGHASHGFPRAEDLPSLGDAMFAALMTAHGVCGRYQIESGTELGEDTLWSMTATLFIEANKNPGRNLALTGAAPRGNGLQQQTQRQEPAMAGAGAQQGGSSPFDPSSDDLPF